MKRRLHRSGFSKIELIVVLVSVVLFVAYVVPVLHRARCGAASLKDKTQIQQIHKSSSLWAADHDGVLPTPGLVQPISGSSEAAGGTATTQDFTLNHSAPMYSMLVMSGHVTPEILVSSRECIEVNRDISVKDDYDFKCYNPAAGTFWDCTFTMRIDDPKIGAHCSFSHRAICGDRRERSWRSTAGSGVAMVGTRGTRGGATEGIEYTRSPTLRLHGPETVWYGHVCFGDNHMETLDTFFPVLSVFFPEGTDKGLKDNVYAAEFAHPHGNHAAADNFLSISVGSTEFTVEDVYDPLE